MRRGGYCARLSLLATTLTSDCSARASLRPRKNAVISLGDLNRINVICAYCSCEFKMAPYFRLFRRYVVMAHQMIDFLDRNAVARDSRFPVPTHSSSWVIAR